MSKVKTEPKQPCPVRNVCAKTGMGRVVAEALVAKCTDAEKGSLASGDMDAVLDIIQKKNAPLPAGKPEAKPSDAVSEAASGQATSRSQ